MLQEGDLLYVKDMLSFFDDLTYDLKTEILNAMKVVHFKKGEIIHSPQGNCLGVLLIKFGEMRTYMLSNEGKEITLYRLVNKDICILSASCVLKNITFDVFIEAVKSCECILINSTLFKKIIEDNIYAKNFALSLTVDRFSDVMWAMEQILFFSFDKRLAVFLLDEINKNNSIRISLTHEQIAKYLGSAREVVSRMVKYFVNEGIIIAKRSDIEIINKEKLITLTR